MNGLKLDVRAPLDGPLNIGTCMEVAQALRQAHGRRVQPHVQIRIYDKSGPVTLCGRLVEVAEGEAARFKVDTDLGAYWVQGRNARMCSGDGRCSCEPLPGSAAALSGQGRKACGRGAQDGTPSGVQLQGAAAEVL